MRTVFLWTAPDVSFSACTVSRYQNLLSARSTLSADLILHESSRLLPRTARIMGRPPVQYRKSRVPGTPNKRTNIVQVRKLSRKAPSPTSHYLATGSDSHPSAEWEPEFAQDVTNDEFTPEPNHKKRRVGSSLNRATTINRPKPGNFGDVVPRKPPVAYGDMTVSIGKPVDATPQL